MSAPVIICDRAVIVCAICASGQLPSMVRYQGLGRYECADEVGCLSRRRELICRMQRALDSAWQAIDAYAAGTGAPQ